MSDYILQTDNLLNTLILVEIFVPTITMFTCSVLLFGTYGFRRPFNLLISAVFLCALMLSVIIFVQFPAIKGFEIFMFADMLGTLLIFPLGYAFLFEWLQPRWLRGKRLLYCYLPPVILLVCFYLCRFTLGRMPPVYTSADVLSNLVYPEMWIRIISFISVVVETAILTVILFRMERKHRETVSDNFSFVEGTNLKWVRFISLQFIAYVLCIVIRDLWGKEIMRLAVGFLITSLALSASIMTMRQQRLYFAPENKEDDQNNEEKPTVLIINQNDKKQNLKEQLLTLLEQDEIFRDPNLSLETVYKMLNTNRTYLSQVINQEMGQNFYQLINSYRIKKAAAMLKDEEQNDITIKDIAFIVGFKSMSTFITLFKETYKMLPSEWRK